MIKHIHDVDGLARTVHGFNAGLDASEEIVDLVYILIVQIVGVIKKEHISFTGFRIKQFDANRLWILTAALPDHGPFGTDQLASAHLVAAKVVCLHGHESRGGHRAT